MTRLVPLLSLLIPTAAFAHPGAHLHPHGAGFSLTAMGVAVIAAGIAWAVYRGR